MKTTAADLVGPKRWARVHKRVWDTPGSIVDIGCEGWLWSRQFLGRKPVVGYGLLSSQVPEGAEYYPMAVGPGFGELILHGSGQETTLDASSRVSVRAVMVSLASVIEKHRPIAALKLNVERMEYAVLATVEHPIADQLAVSFHHHASGDAWRAAWTVGMINVLKQWYEPVKLHRRWGWWLFVKR